MRLRFAHVKSLWFNGLLKLQFDVMEHVVIIDQLLNKRHVAKSGHGAKSAKFHKPAGMA